MIPRLIETPIRALLASDSSRSSDGTAPRRMKVIIVLGARQVGKTTLLESMLKAQPRTLWLSGDDPDVVALFQNINTARLRAIIGDAACVVVDEAQRIADIGLKLKLITDQMPGVRVIAIGSSSFDLANSVNEPLSGRKHEFTLFPLTFSEMVAHHSLLEEIRLLEHRLVFGSYPEVVTSPGSERSILREITESYLYKDILSHDRVKKSDSMTRLLRALAFQIGSQVSTSEISNLCGIDIKTVERYITILEQAFVVFRLGSYSRNLRNELKVSRKIFFVDNGVRNAIIADFRPVELRDDIGKLWENYLVSERIKKLRYAESYANSWFWRTHQQQEIGYLEEQDGRLHAYEFKWNSSAKVRPPKTFLAAYPNSDFQVVNRENYDSFLL